MDTLVHKPYNPSSGRYGFGMLPISVTFCLLPLPSLSGVVHVVNRFRHLDVCRLDKLVNRSRSERKEAGGLLGPLTLRSNQPKSMEFLGNPV